MKHFHFALILLALLTAASNATRRNPGIKLALTPQAFNDFIQYFVPQVLNQFSTVRIGNFTAGGYNISKLTISNMYLATNATKVEFDHNHLNFTTESFGLEARCLLEGKALSLIPVNFNTGASKNQSKLTFTASFDYTGPEVRIVIESFQIRIRELKFYFPSTVLGNIATALTELLQRPIQSILSGTLSKKLKGTFTDVFNQLYDKIPEYGQIPKTPMGMSFESLFVPVITPDFILASLNGTFYDLSTGIIPSDDNPIVTPSFDYNSGQAIQAVLTEYSVNSALNAIWRAGLLTYDVKKNVVPAGSPVQMSVFWLKVLIPHLHKHYTNDAAELMLRVQAISAPLLKFTPGNIRLEAPVAITFNVVEGVNLSHVFTLSTTIEANVNITLKNWTVHPKLFDIDFKDYAVLHSNIGQFDLSKISGTFMVAVMFAVPLIEREALSYALPTFPAADLSETSFEILNGYLRIETTPKYVPFDLMKFLGKEIDPTDAMMFLEESEALSLLQENGQKSEQIEFLSY